VRIPVRVWSHRRARGAARAGARAGLPTLAAGGVRRNCLTPRFREPSWRKPGTCGILRRGGAGGRTELGRPGRRVPGHYAELSNAS
jgi:hypothetical protein